MSTRATKGVLRVGSVACDTTGGIWFDRDRAKHQIKAISFTSTSTAETDTSYDIPSSCIVRDVWLKITTASSAGGTMNVGLLASESGGDADGFVASISTTSTGIKYPTFTHTEATSGDIITGNKRGALISAHATGTTDLGSWGFYSTKAHPSDLVSSKSISYTVSATGGGPAGTIFIEFTEI